MELFSGLNSRITGYKIDVYLYMYVRILYYLIYVPFSIRESTLQIICAYFFEILYSLYAGWAQHSTTIPHTQAHSSVALSRIHECIM